MARNHSKVNFQISFKAFSALNGLQIIFRWSKTYISPYEWQISLIAVEVNRAMKFVNS